MRRFICKLTVALLSICMIGSGFAIPNHAMGANGAEPQMHMAQAVQSYADLAVDPADDCPHATSDHSSDKHGKGAQTCCTACVPATVIPAAPLLNVLRTARAEPLAAYSTVLHGRSIPTEPGIPKHL